MAVSEGQASFLDEVWSIRFFIPLSMYVSIKPDTCISYWSVSYRATIVVCQLLITHQRATLVHWMTCSFITMNSNQQLFLFFFNQSHVHYPDSYQDTKCLLIHSRKSIIHSCFVTRAELRTGYHLFDEITEPCFQEICHNQWGYEVESQRQGREVESIETRADDVVQFGLFVGFADIEREATGSYSKKTRERQDLNCP